MNKFAKITILAMPLAVAFNVSAQRAISRVPVNVDKTEQIEVTDDGVYVEVKGDANDLNGDWTICDVQGNKITGEELPTLNFQIKEGRFYGNNGCNVINGGLVFQGKNGIRFINPISTMRYCANDKYSSLVNQTLEQINTFKISQYRHVYYVDLYNSKGQIVMTLRNNNAKFLNGAWRVTEINGMPVENKNVKMVIDIPEKHLHANAGCNTINGKIETDANNSNALQFKDLMSTRMLCPDMETETSFLVALEQTAVAVADNNNNAVFYDNAGTPVMKLVRVSYSDLLSDK